MQRIATLREAVASLKVQFLQVGSHMPEVVPYIARGIATGHRQVRGNLFAFQGDDMTIYKNKKTDTAIAHTCAYDDRMFRDTLRSIKDIVSDGEKVHFVFEFRDFSKDNLKDIANKLVWLMRNGDIFVYLTTNNEESRNLIKKLSSIESPIEQLCWDSIMTSHKHGFPWSMFAHSEIETQYPVEKYRIDIAMPSLKIAIELDGHDYHKTKQQRTHDAKKDRTLSLLGWHVIRFTGSEVYNNPVSCGYDFAELHNMVKTAERGVYNER